jgi:Ca-activated chloride channel family protein
MARPLSWRGAWPLPLLALLLLTLVCSAADSNRPDFTFRANVNEVRVTFSATDQKDHGVPSLRSSDLVVVDKDIIVRNFQSFTRTNWTNLDLAILIDTSASVTPRFRQEISSVVELLASTGIADENLSLFSFRNGKPALLCAQQCRGSNVLEDAPRGLTPLFDTIVLASRYLAARADADREKVLIIFSDGDDTISEHSLDDAVTAATRSEVKIYGIDLGRAAASNGAAVLYNFADETGGRYFPARSGVQRTLNALLDDFQATYTVTYRLPTRDPGFHRIQVLPTKNLKLHFRSRSGYYLPN